MVVVAAVVVVVAGAAAAAVLHQEDHPAHCAAMLINAARVFAIAVIRFIVGFRV